MKKLLLTVTALVLMLSLVGQIVAQEEEVLTETFTTESGDMSINHPEGWEIFSENGVTFLANVGLDVFNEDMLPSDAILFMFLTPDALTTLGLDVDGPPLDIVENLIVLILEEEAEGGTDISEPEEITLDNEAENEVLITRISDATADGFVGAVKFDAGIIGVAAIASPGEYEKAEPTIRAILDTLMLQEPATVVVPEEKTPPEDNAVTWETDTVTLTADNFYIQANGEIFTADVDDIDIDGDPGSDEYTTLEVTWMEHDVEMRLYIYFEADDEEWRAFEIRIYDGNDPGEWITWESEQFSAPLGDSYTVFGFGRQIDDDRLDFDGLEVQAFTSAE